MDHIFESMQSLSIYDDDNLAKLEEILNYKFNNKRLLQEALTHSSMDYTKSYERLEFLGDSVLSYLIAKHLHSTYPELDPGTLSELRSRNVENGKFAEVSVKHKFHEFLRMKQQPELQLLIEKFVKSTEDKSESKSLQLEDVKAPKVLADIVESIAGAVLVDSGHFVDKVWEIFMPLLEVDSDLVTPDTLEQDPVTELQELCEKHGKVIEYRYRPRKGKIMRAKVLINGKGIAIGEHQQKELAKREAAKHGVDKLKEMIKEEEIVQTTQRHEKLCIRDLNNFCSKNHWPAPLYRLVQEEPRAYTKKFAYAVSVCTENGWTAEYVGNPMPRKKEAKRSAAKAILDGFDFTNFT